MKYLTFCFVSFLFAATSFAQTHNPPCPDTYLFTVGGLHYYQCISCDAECEDFALTPIVAAYDKPPALGCLSGSIPCTCNAIDPPISVIWNNRENKRVVRIKKGEKIILPGGNNNPDRLISIQVGQTKVWFEYE